MLKPDSSLPRQLRPHGPIALWRDGQTGREGLILSVRACDNPKCSCRDVTIEGWLVDEHLIGVSSVRHSIQFTFDGKARTPERKVLTVAVDIDAGNTASEGSEPWALEWFKKECDAELLACLRGQFEAVKDSALPTDWRTADWSHWKPGRDVGWRDFFPDDDEAADLVLDGQTYVFGDTYCVEPGCSCDEVQVIVWHEAADGELTDLGAVTVAPTKPAGAQFQAHGRQREQVQKLWSAWCEAHPMTALLSHRQREVRKLAPELHVLMGPRAKAASPKELGRNDLCPCGSGKKYKKCCMA